MSLELLTALQTSKFTADELWFCPSELKNKINVIGNPLASASSPIGTRFVGIDIFFCLNSKQLANSLMNASSVLKSSEWSLMDEALSGPMFMDLQSVEMRVITHT
jgi:hypothetical protein